MRHVLSGDSHRPSTCAATKREVLCPSTPWTRLNASKNPRQRDGQTLHRCGQSRSSSPRSSGHSAANPILRKLVKKYPHDIQARIFLAEAVGDGYDENGEPKAGQKERIAILEGILREAPNDSAANHYWIHAMEPGNHPERAIPSAALLASLAPTSGHMVHMPGHIYYRVGDYAQAEHWFAASMTADETYMRDQHVAVDDDWNYVHNMMYAIANLMEQGKLSEANALSDHLAGARGKLSATLYIWSARDQMARISRRLPVALRTADWDTVLALLSQANLPEADKTANLRFLASELSDFAAGMKALDSNDVCRRRKLPPIAWMPVSGARKRDTDTADEAKKKARRCMQESRDGTQTRPPRIPDLSRRHGRSAVQGSQRRVHRTPRRRSGRARANSKRSKEGVRLRHR